MPALVDQTASSPLSFLISEQKHGDGQAREALFCSFAVDLGYFEQAVLSAAEATGARVTVVGDARASDPDPGAAAGAGTRYVHGLAAPGAGGAFHARVMVVAGHERALVAVGSGDLSAGGWGLDKESWTVATANREACPELVADVADWLRSLDSLCVLAPLAASGISRTAALLEELAVEAEIVDTGHRLVHSSARPVVAQLPVGEVDHLQLYAPSHDERTAAVQELIVRLRPARVTLAVQSGGRTVIQPAALRRVIAAAGTPFEIVEDAAERYRHETLIEAVRPDGSRWALTGSPDLSVRALLTPAGKGGNIEVGVVSRPAASLFPEATRPLPPEEVPAVRQPGSARARPADGAVVLAATRAGGGLEVTLARPTSWPTPLEASRAEGTGAWEAIGSVPAGAASHVLAGADRPGGTRVRCAGDASGAPGPVVFVADPELAMLRAQGRTARAQEGQPGPAELIADPPLLERWLADAGSLAATHPGGTAVRGPQPDAGEEGWFASADDAQARLGTAMFRLALGELPSGLTGSALARARDRSGPERRKVRQLLTAATGQAAARPAIVRLALLALVLCGAEAGTWDGPQGPDGWVPVGAVAVRNLVRGDIPDRLEAAAASWAALALYLMHERRQASGKGAEAAAYEEARAAAASLLPGVSAALVANLATPFTNKSGFPVDPDAVMHVTGLAAQEDPLAEAIDALASARPDWSVHSHGGRLLHLKSGGRGTFLHAAEALERMPGNMDTAVWATGTTPAWAIAVRFEGALVHVECDTSGQLLWRHYRLGPLATPTALARNPELATRSRINHGILRNPFPEAIQALLATGVDLTGGTPSDCPD
ncbi:MAG TPA: hypothetical protein VH021_16705 [Trebonia sp.]|nr:hypothetical protein [Trebonia sp.]